MKEFTCHFGEQDRLSGIVTVPSPAKCRSAALILVSAGLTAKAGPYRLYAETARSLAAIGITTLRFDLGGIGNSEQVAFDAPLPVRTDADLGAAVAWLKASQRPDHLLLGGLCSGAEDAFRYAGQHAGVAGVFMVDPHAFRTGSWWLHHFISLRSMKNMARDFVLHTGLVQAIGAFSDALGGRESEGALINYPYMRRAEASRILGQLVRRGTRVHYIYTADRSERFNHAGQLRHMFPGLDFDDRVSVAYLPQLEHTQFLAEDRAAVIASIRDWVDAVLEPRAAPTASGSALLATSR